MVVIQPCYLCRLFGPFNPRVYKGGIYHFAGLSFSGIIAHKGNVITTTHSRGFSARDVIGGFAVGQESVS